MRKLAYTLRMGICLHVVFATDNRIPYGITQCCLPPGRCDFSAFTPAEAAVVLDLATPKGCKDELTWVMVTSPQHSYLPQKITGSAVTGIRTHDRESLVRHPIHYTTDPRCAVPYRAVLCDTARGVNWAFTSLHGAL